MEMKIVLSVKLGAGSFGAEKVVDLQRVQGIVKGHHRYLWHHNRGHCLIEANVIMCQDSDMKNIWWTVFDGHNYHQPY